MNKRRINDGFNSVKPVKLLNIGRTTVYRMFDRGELEKVRRLGRSVKVKLPDKLAVTYAEQIKALIN